MHFPATRSLVIAVVALLIVVGAAYAGLNGEEGQPAGPGSSVEQSTPSPEPSESPEPSPDDRGEAEHDDANGSTQASPSPDDDGAADDDDDDGSPEPSESPDDD
jgi:hypothetical protein